MPAPASVGANWFSLMNSRPAVRSCVTLPRSRRSDALVWLEKISFLRSLAWREIVTISVTGSNAAALVAVLMTASRCVRLKRVWLRSVSPGDRSCSILPR